MCKSILKNACKVRKYSPNIQTNCNKNAVTALFFDRNCIFIRYNALFVMQNSRYGSHNIPC